MPPGWWVELNASVVSIPEELAFLKTGCVSLAIIFLLMVSVIILGFADAV